MNIDNFFAGFETKDSYAVLFIMLIAFLFGFLVAWLLRSAALQRARAAAEEAATKQAQAEAQLQAANQLIQQRNEELQEESREKVALMDQVQQYEAEKTRHYTEISQLNASIGQLNAELERLRATGSAYTSTIDELNEQIVSLSQQPPTPTILAVVESTPPAPLPTTESVVLADDRLAKLEQGLQVLADENRQLRADLDQLQQLQSSTTTANTPATTTNLLAAIPMLIEEPEADFSSDRSVSSERIAEDDRQRDDLTRIEGIGPFLESQLNQIGVLTWADIAAWDAAHIETVTQAIAYFPGRIEKDNWVGQAQQLLHQTSEPLLLSTRAEPEDTTILPTEAADESAHIPDAPAQDDLTAIEGIGPKIEELLKSAGIRTWHDLAATDPGVLRELLDGAGDQFRIHAPYTWPLQARLAAAGRWDELKEYQLELRGGRDLNP